MRILTKTKRIIAHPCNLSTGLKVSLSLCLSVSLSLCLSVSLIHTHTHTHTQRERERERERERDMYRTATRRCQGLGLLPHHILLLPALPGAVILSYPQGVIRISSRVCSELLPRRNSVVTELPGGSTEDGLWAVSKWLLKWLSNTGM